MHRHTHTDTQTHTHIFSLTGPGAWLLLLSSLPPHQAPERSSLPLGCPQRRSWEQQGPGQWKFAAHFLGEGKWQECTLSCLALEPWGPGPWVGHPWPHTPPGLPIPPIPGPVRSLSLCALYSRGGPLPWWVPTLGCLRFIWGFGEPVKGPGVRPWTHFITSAFCSRQPSGKPRVTAVL